MSSWDWGGVQVVGPATPRAEKVEGGGWDNHSHIREDGSKPRRPQPCLKHQQHQTAGRPGGKEGGERGGHLPDLDTLLSRSQGGDIAVPPSRAEMVPIARSRSGTQSSPSPTCLDEVCHGSEGGRARRTGVDCAGMALNESDHGNMSRWRGLTQDSVGSA